MRSVRASTRIVVKRGRVPTGWEPSGTGTVGGVLLVFREQPLHAKAQSKTTKDAVFTISVV